MCVCVNQLWDILDLRFRNYYFLLCVCVNQLLWDRFEVQNSLLPVVCVCEPVVMGYIRFEVQKLLLPVVGV